jgi:hypothetical protein
MSAPLLTPCARHGLLPYHFICEHLIKGSSDWQSVAVEDGRDVEFDWVCGGCIGRYKTGQAMALHVLCMLCLRDLTSRS